jgi:hypothetical protein
LEDCGDGALVFGAGVVGFGEKDDGTGAGALGEDAKGLVPALDLIAALYEEGVGGFGAVGTGEVCAGDGVAVGVF